MQSHTVYKCLCGNCSVTYYGKTEHQLNVTSREDIAILHLTGKSRFKPSAVSNHLLLHIHESDFNDFTILCRGNNGFRLLLKEFIISSSESWFYIMVDFVLVKSTKMLMKREITIISFAFVLGMHYLLNFEFFFFFKFIFRLFAFFLIHTDIIH